MPAGTYTIDLAPTVATGGPYVSQWTWSNVISSGPYYTQGSGNRQEVFTIAAGQRAQFTVSGNVSGCGTITRTFTLATSGGYRYAFAPNPASDELTVVATDAAAEGLPAASAAAPPFEAALYDGFGKRIKVQQSTQGKAKIDVRNLPNGLYNLRGGYGKGALSECVQLAH